MTVSAVVEFNEIKKTPIITAKNAKYSYPNNVSLKYKNANKTRTIIPTLPKGAITVRGAMEIAIRKNIHPSDVNPVPNSHLLHARKAFAVFFSSLNEIVGKFSTSLF